MRSVKLPISEKTLVTMLAQSLKLCKKTISLERQGIRMDVLDEACTALRNSVFDILGIEVTLEVEKEWYNDWECAFYYDGKMSAKQAFRQLCEYSIHDLSQE